MSTLRIFAKGVLAPNNNAENKAATMEVRELADAGMTVGFHGLHHRSWRSLGAQELKDDLERGRSVLEDALGRAVTEASCPFDR